LKLETLDALMQVSLHGRRVKNVDWARIFYQKPEGFAFGVG